MAEREEEEGFLGRWSRMKREARAEEPAASLVPKPEPVETAETEVVEEAPELPPLDSLGSDSDYTGFLRREVPAELRREALRKAWVSDPVIAGFRGFAEYDWDYNAPGYGALRPTDDIARLLEAVLPDEKREEEETVEEEMVVAGQVPDTATTCPHPDPPPLGGGGRLAAELKEEQSSLPRPAGEG